MREVVWYKQEILSCNLSQNWNQVGIHYVAKEMKYFDEQAHISCATICIPTMYLQIYFITALSLCNKILWINLDTFAQKLQWDAAFSASPHQPTMM